MGDTRVKSKERAAVFLHAAMQALDAAGGSLALGELRQEVEKRVALTAHDRAIYEKSGYVRWQSILHFYSIDYQKAGFLKKADGKWYLTPEGREALKFSPEQILEMATKAYRVWRAAQEEAASGPTESETPEDEGREAARSLVFEDAQGQALREIQEYILALGPYEFQDLVAALLRGMGYATPFVAPKGPDGGTDIIAYPDPLGTQTPHIRVQVKHRRDTKATREEIAALRGVIRSDREIGLFVSTAGFTSDAGREARQGTVHIELIDLDRFLNLWLAQYDKLAEEDKAALRLRKVYFLAPD